MSNAIYQESTSVTLLQGLRNRDPSAWARVAKIYGPLIQNWCRDMGLDEASRGDISQNVLVKVIRYAASFRTKHPRGSFRGWLKVITRREVLDHQSHSQRLQAIDPQVLEGTLIDQFDAQPEDNPEQMSELHRRALQVLQEMSKPATWAIFADLLETGDEHSVIAARHNTTTGNVRVIKFRMLAKLNGILELNDDSGDQKSI